VAGDRIGFGVIFESLANHAILRVREQHLKDAIGSVREFGE
jgi:hypothetical protein